MPSLSNLPRGLSTIRWRTRATGLPLSRQRCSLLILQLAAGAPREERGLHVTASICAPCRSFTAISLHSLSRKERNKLQHSLPRNIAVSLVFPAGELFLTHLGAEVTFTEMWQHVVDVLQPHWAK